MKKFILSAFCAASLLTSFSQKISNEKKNQLYKTPAFWQQVSNQRLQQAPTAIRASITKMNDNMVKSGKSLRFTYTSVSELPIPDITGFAYDGKRDISMDVRPLDGPPPARCLNITASATDRRVDMREYGIITSVRNQLHCGSCWTFATISALETAWLIKNGGDAAALDLAEAQVLRCCGTTPGGCSGGMQADAVGYVKGHNIARETEFPMPAENVDILNIQCNNFSTTSPFRASAGGFVTGSVFLPSPSQQQLKQSICRYGSVAACIRATASFKRYSSGVYDIDEEPGNVFPNHVIQIIGWDDDLQAWLIKNSWDSTWGEGGFGWVKYNTNKVGAYAVWVEAATAPGNPCVTVTNNPNPTNNNTNNLGAGFEQLSMRFNASQTHRLIAMSNGLTVEVDDPVVGNEKGAKVQQWSSHAQIALGSDGHNQEWWFLQCGKRDNKPVYRIFNNGFSNFLTDNGGRARTEYSNSSGNQLWFIENTATAGVYYIKNVYSQKYLQVPLGNREGDPASLALFAGSSNQQFRINTINQWILGEGQYDTSIWISPEHASSKALDLANGRYDNTNPIQIWDNMRGNGNQNFRILWDGDARAFTIFSKKDPMGNKCVEVKNFSQDNGGEVVIWEKVGGDNQYWYVLPITRESGKFIFINKNSGKCLDVSGVGTTNGTRVQQWDYVGGNNQKWRIHVWQ